MILCATVDMGELKKDIAKEALGSFVELLSSAPGSIDVADRIQKSYQAVKQELKCEGVYWSSLGGTVRALTVLHADSL